MKKLNRLCTVGNAGATRRRLLHGMATGALVATVAAPSFAAQDDWPRRPIRLVVPFSPGGFTDVVARIVGHSLGERLGQPVVVENKPGAGSTIGTDGVAKAAPDGYTLALVSTTHVISPRLYKSVPYDPLKDFVAIGRVVEAPYVLVVTPGFAPKNVAEYVAAARAQPDKYHFASSGNGSTQHLIGALFAKTAQAPIRHIPFRGSAQAMQDVIAGIVESSFAGITNALPHIRSGRVRALAVTSATRASQLPDVPTMQEAGLAGFDASPWLALLAPAATPAAIVERLSTELNKVLADEAVLAAFDEAGVSAAPSDPARMQALLQAESERWGQVVKDTGIKVD
ncbi:MAG: Bug family tripartite tricarboxylate transporter substrate binding protein [Lautropia sp.]